MTAPRTTTTGTGTRPATVATESAETDDPGDRGRLDINSTVLRKIAEHVADSVPGTVRAPRRIAGLGFGEQGSSARVARHGGRLRVALDVALSYPSPVRDTVTTIRERVGADIARIAGDDVSAVNVTVSALLPAGPGRRVE